MTPMVPTRPTRSASPPLPVSKHQCRVPLLADLGAAAAARAVVQESIRAWRSPVDPDVAILLTSELVANAVTHGAPAAGKFVLLTLACEAAWLRVDVHDGSGDLPVLDAASAYPAAGARPGEGADPEAFADAETGRGLLLVTSLSAEWGFYRTPGGKAVYFTLTFPGDDGPVDNPSGDGIGRTE